jgi:hypothetical protein
VNPAPKILPTFCCHCLCNFTERLRALSIDGANRNSKENSRGFLLGLSTENLWNFLLNFVSRSSYKIRKNFLENFCCMSSWGVNRNSDKFFGKILLHIHNKILESFLEKFCCAFQQKFLEKFLRIPVDVSHRNSGKFSWKVGLTVSMENSPNFTRKLLRRGQGDLPIIFANSCVETARAILVES